MLFLTVREDGRERTVRTDGVRVVLGSAEGCDIRLASRGVARRHALLRGVGYDFEIVPMEAPEGVLFEGRRTGPRRVDVGDVYRLGGAEVVIEEWALEFPVQPSSLDLLERRRPDPPSFDETLYLALRGSPPWFVSAGVHGAVLLALFLLTPAPRPVSPWDRTLAAGLEGAEPAVERDGADGPVGAVPREDLAAAAPRDSAPPPRALDLPEDLAAGAEDSVGPAGVGEDLPVLGLSGSLPEGFGTRIPRSAAGNPRKSTTPVRADFGEDTGFGEDGADGAQGRAAGILEGVLGGEGGGLNRVRTLDPRRVIVTRGAYDSAESLFRVLRLRHELIAPEDLPVVPLSPEGVLIIDCGNQIMDAAQSLRVRRFVEEGGFLCTTDWALVNVLEPSFPGYVRALGGQGGRIATVDESVPFRVVAHRDPLVEGLAEVAQEALWWVEDRGFPVEVMATHRVKVLVESPALRQRYGAGALAVTFRHGRGQVLHLLGHLWQKKGNVRGAYAMQRLLTNFLLLRAAGDEEGGAARPAATSERPGAR